MRVGHVATPGPIVWRGALGCSVLAVLLTLSSGSSNVLNLRKPIYWVSSSHFPDAIYVLDVFVKKSKHGIGTPQQVRERVMSRFLLAEQHYFGQRR